MGIEGIGNNQPQINPEQLSPLVSDKVLEKVIGEVAPLLNAAGNLNVRESRGTDKNTNTVLVSDDVPEIDDVKRELLERLAVDLEALIALLQADTTKSQIQSTKDRIESLQGQLKQQHEETMAKINESLDELKDQYESYVAQKVLGWLGVLVAVAMAVLSVVTCGGATAAFAVVGAVIAVGLQVLNETGVMEDLMKAIADSLKSSGMSSTKAEALAQLFVAMIQLALSLVGVVGGAVCAYKGVAATGKALVQLSAKVMKGIQIAQAVTGGVMSAAGMAASGAATAINYKASETQAELTELQAILKKLQTTLEEEEEDLKELLQQLANCTSAVADLLIAKQDWIQENAMNISA